MSHQQTKAITELALAYRYNGSLPTFNYIRKEKKVQKCMTETFLINHRYGFAIAISCRVCHFCIDCL